MSYRLLPKTDLKGQIQDVFACLDWFAKNARQFHCDLNRVFLTGDSSGGHLAALSLCIQKNPFLQKLYGVNGISFDIKALALSHGVCNPVAGITGNKYIDREIHRMFFGKKPEANPLYPYADFTAVAEGFALPPIMLISGEMDRLNVWTFALRGYLEKHGIKYREKFWKKEQSEKLIHVFHVSNPQWKESMETNEEMLAFFRESEEAKSSK
jgi:acetyl esterase/lipase